MYNSSVEGFVQEKTLSDWPSQEKKKKKKKKRGFQPAVRPYLGQFSELMFTGLIYYEIVNTKGIIKIR